MKKKILIISTLLILIIMLAFILIYNYNKWQEVEINLKSDYNELFTTEEMKNKGHLKIIPEYSSDVTIGYENKDSTKTLYVYASPIRYWNSSGQMTMIDTRIANLRNKELRDKGYVYTIANSDIKSFYPKKLSSDTGILIKGETEYEFGVNNNSFCSYEERNNFIKEKKYMLVYEDAVEKGIDIQFYPTSLGSNCEILYNNEPKSNVISMWLNVNDDKVDIRKEPGGYIVFTKKNDINNNILAVIQKPLIKSIDGKISYNSAVDIEKNENSQYRLIFTLDRNALNKGSIIFISFEMRREKQPDNAIYSNLPDLEYAYLRNYSVVGNSSDYGLGRLMIRYRFTKIFNLSADSILKANYLTYALTENNDKLHMLSILEDWCSLTGNWNENYKTGEQTSFVDNITNNLNFDITEEVKKWCEEPTGIMEHNGILLKSINEQPNIYNVILSNDNSLYGNRTEIILDD